MREGGKEVKRKWVREGEGGRGRKEKVKEEGESEGHRGGGKKK